MIKVYVKVPKNIKFVIYFTWFKFCNHLLQKSSGGVINKVIGTSNSNIILATIQKNPTESEWTPWGN